MQSIESSQNRKFKNWLSLLESKGIQTQHRAILAGKKVIHDTLNVHSDYAIALLVPLISKSDIKFGGETYSLSSKLFDQLDVFGTGYPLLEVKVPLFEKWSVDEKVKNCALYLPQ